MLAVPPVGSARPTCPHHRPPPPPGASTAGATSSRSSLAEFIVWLGFGGAAARPAALLHRAGHRPRLPRPRHRRLAGRPARRRARLRLARRPDRTGPADGHRASPDRLFSFLPLVFTGPLAFLLLRAGAGLARLGLRPGGRGYLTDATPPERRGEAFGLYGAAQMGGLLLGPAIGAFGAERFGGIAFVFVFSGVASVLARDRDRPARPRGHGAAGPTPPRRRTPPSSRVTRPRSRADAATDIDADRAVTVDARAPTTPAEPRPDRGPHHQRRRLLRGRHVRGHLEPVPRATSARASTSSA